MHLFLPKKIMSKSIFEKQKLSANESPLTFEISMTVMVIK